MADDNILMYQINDNSEGIRATQLNYVCIPNYTLTPQNGWLYDCTVNYLEEHLPLFYNRKVTMFVGSADAVGVLSSFGFTNVIYFSAGDFIELSNGNRIARSADGIYLTAIINGDEYTITTYPNYSTFPYDCSLPVSNPDIYHSGWCITNINTITNNFAFNFNLSTVILQQNYDSLLEGAVPYEEGVDPFGPGGYSGTGGGGGDFDGTSIPIDFPPLPTLSAVDTGFITLFHPNTSQLQSFANYMWNDLDLTNFHKLFNDPMEAVLGLSIVPFHPPDAGMKQVIIGNVMAISIQMPGVSTQWKEIDCGTINVNEFWGAYLDYDPFTKIEIYLPFIGVRPLNIDDVMGKTVHLKYQFDVLSGACTAMLKCGDSVLYTHSGNCATTVPIAGKDWANVINGALQVAAAVGLAVASDGAAIPAVAAASSATSGAVSTMKTKIAKSSNISGANGLISPKQPYLILTRPRQCLPHTQDESMGYPSFMDVSFSSLRGYTEVESVHLTNIEATDAELSEIYEWLERGVIF